ncbi:hypothetical protein Bbelb_411220 [Branchiostoma belcheri]|nr:hypothetical protein Bbelb_411220 [Branchiostoma belcheri]
MRPFFLGDNNANGDTALTAKFTLRWSNRLYVHQGFNMATTMNNVDVGKKYCRARDRVQPRSQTTNHRSPPSDELGLSRSVSLSGNAVICLKLKLSHTCSLVG